METHGYRADTAKQGIRSCSIDNPASLHPRSFRLSTTLPEPTATMKLTTAVTLAVAIFTPLTEACKCWKDGQKNNDLTRECCKQFEKSDHPFIQFLDDCSWG